MNGSTLLLFILVVLALPYLKFQPNTNRNIALVLVIIAILLFVAWPIVISVRAGN